MGRDLHHRDGSHRRHQHDETLMHPSARLGMASPDACPRNPPQASVDFPSSGNKGDRRFSGGGPPPPTWSRTRGPTPPCCRGPERVYIEEVGAGMPFRTLTKIARDVPGGSRRGGLRGPRLASPEDDIARPTSPMSC